MLKVKTIIKFYFILFYFFLLKSFGLPFKKNPRSNKIVSLFKSSAQVLNGITVNLGTT